MWGLPLAVAFARHYKVFGFDINQERIIQLNNKIDVTNEIVFAEQKIKNLIFTDDLEGLKKCNIYIITVPTPIDQNNQPDLTYLVNATESIAKILKTGEFSHIREHCLSRVYR
jgi:UDP-N-acetyl-D-galactosamine dehydrogenase